MKTFNHDSTENSAIISQDGLKYTTSYFGIHFAGINSRGLLAYAGADWKNVSAKWPAEKADMPFEVVPVLTIHAPDGKELVLSEGMAIDIFLAKQFGLYGTNAWEEALINAYYSNSQGMFFQGTMNNFYWESAQMKSEEKVQAGKTWLTKSLADWARIHEAHLVGNQLNGHYVGNKTSLADIRTTTFLDAVEKIFGTEKIATVVNQSLTPGIMAVRAKVESKASYAAWLASEEYKNLDEGSFGFIKNHHPELFVDRA